MQMKKCTYEVSQSVKADQPAWLAHLTPHQALDSWQLQAASYDNLRFQVTVSHVSKNKLSLNIKKGLQANGP